MMLELTGELEIWKTDLEGRSKKIRHIKNDIVDGGEFWVAELLAKEELGGTELSQGTGELGDGLQYSQVGWGTSATTYDMYSLQSTSGITTNNYIDVDNDVDTPGNKIVCRSTYTTGDGNCGTALSEAGLFSNTAAPGSSTDTSSRMFNRTTFPGISKNDTFSLTLQWTITIGVAGS